MIMRTRASLAVSVSAVVAALVAGQAVAADKPNLAGVWLVEKPQAELKTADGKAPPLKPAAAKLYAERKAAKASGKKSDEEHTDPVGICLPHGVPRLLSDKQPIMILQKPKQI